MKYGPDGYPIMDPDGMDEYDDEGEYEGNESVPQETPNPFMALSKIFNGKNKRYPKYKIFNGQYFLEVDNIVPEGRISKESTIYLTAVINPDYEYDKDEKPKDIYDVMSFLSNTYFLNFVLANDFGICQWSNEGISVTYRQYYDKDNILSYRIFITIQDLGFPNWLSNISSGNCVNCGLLETPIGIKGSNIFGTASFMRHYTLPLIYTTITLTYPPDSGESFDGTDWYEQIYNNFITNYIRHAIYQLYPKLSSSISNIKIYNEYLATHKSLHTYFDVNYEGELLVIKMLVSPAYYIDGNNVYSYEYTNVGHAVSLAAVDTLESETPLDGIPLGAYLNNIMSTSMTQTLANDIHPLGAISVSNKDYMIYSQDAMFFAPLRYIAAESIDIGCAATILESPESSTLWGSSKTPLVSSIWQTNATYQYGIGSIKKSIRVYGFINFNMLEINNSIYEAMPLIDLLEAAIPEIKGRLDIERIHDFFYSEHAIINEVYRDEEVLRILLAYRIVDEAKKENSHDLLPSKNDKLFTTSDNKKKSGFFRRNK